MNKPLDDKTRPETWPDWKLERFLLGELPAEEARDLGNRAQSDPDLARRLADLRAEHAALRAAHPTEAMAAGIERRLRLAGQLGRTRPAQSARPALPSRAAGAGSPLAAAASAAAAIFGALRRPLNPVWTPALAMLLVLALLPFTRFSPFRSGAVPDGLQSGGESGDETGGESGSERLKGLEPRLILHRQQPEGSVQLSSGAAARTGDLIQIQYESAGRAHGALYSLDAEGKVTRHLPDRGGRSAALKAGGPVALDFAYELDDAAGWERFYLITSEQPFDLGEVEDALRRAQPADRARAHGPDSLPLRKGLGQCQFILLKEPGT